MKLLYFLAADSFFCSHFLARAVAAQKAGYEVVVVTPMRAHKDILKEHGLCGIDIQLDRRSANLWQELNVIRQACRIYRAEKPDIVHHVALKPVLYGSIAARLARVPRVINAPVGMGYVFISQSFKAQLLRFVVSFGLRFVLNPPHSKVIFENNDDRESFIRKNYVRREDAVLIRGAGIDTQQFYPVPEPEGIPVVILTARMLWDKGVGEFVEAARLLHARGVKARFLLVGAPDRFNRAAISEDILQQWHAEGVVDYLGHRTDIVHLLQQSHIMCLPSYREGLPKSLLEALACGKPVVTTDVPGCREAVKQGVNGLMVPARDAKALAAALADLIASPEKRAAMGQAGRKMAEQEFSQERVVAETLSVYQS